jgi:hypothetical protein
VNAQAGLRSDRIVRAEIKRLDRAIHQGTPSPASAAF